MTGGILSHPQLLKTIIPDFLLLSCLYLLGALKLFASEFSSLPYDTDVQVLEQKK